MTYSNATPTATISRKAQNTLLNWIKIFTFNTFSTRKFWTTKDDTWISFIKFIPLNTTLLTGSLLTSDSECPKKNISSMIRSYPGGIIALIKMFFGPEKLLDLMETNLLSKLMDSTMDIKSHLSTSIRSGTTKNWISFWAWSEVPSFLFSYSSGYLVAI